jgi:hypothetical protein
MTKENKVKLLAAFDQLNDIVDWSNGHRSHERKCGECGHMDSTSVPHSPLCELNNALVALGKRVPPFLDRDKWLAET